MEWTDTFLEKIAIRHGFIKESEMESFRNVQQKLQQNGINKTLMEIFEYKKVFNKEDECRFKLLLQFFEQRILGSIICNLAIEKEYFSKEEYVNVLITHRSIYKLTQKVVPLSQITSLKKICDKSMFEKLEHEISCLPLKEYQQLWGKNQKNIFKEDAVALKLREKQPKAVSSNLKKNNENAIGDPTQVPPSKLENNDNISLIELEKNQKQIHLSELVKSQEEMPFSKLGKHEEKIPETKLDTVRNTASKQEIKNSIHKEHKLEIFECEQIPVEKEQKKIVFISFLAAILVFSLLIVAFYSLRSTDEKEILIITQLLANGDNITAENRCRNFIRTYPKSEHFDSARKMLQNLLINKTKITLNQDKLGEALEFIDEATGIVSNSNMDTIAQELRKEVWNQKSLASKKQQWQEELRKIKVMISEKKWQEARGILDNIIIEYDYIWTKSDFKKIELFYKEALLKYKYTKYTYVNKIPKYDIFSPANSPENIIVEKLALGEVNDRKFSQNKAHFFVTNKNHFYCLDSKNGKIKWLENVIDTKYHPLFLAGPRQNFNMKIADKVLLPKNPTTLSLLRTKNGETIWKTKLPVMSSQPTIYKKRIYVGTYNHYCIELDLDSGSILGGYRTGESPIYPVAIDRKLNFIHIPCRDAIYTYQKDTGKLLHIIPYKNTPSAPPIVASPYLCSFVQENKKTKIHVYNITATKYSLLKTITIDGVMTMPAVLSCGNLAVTTNKYLSLYSLNPKNLKEAIFPLNSFSILRKNAKAVMQFSNLGRTLTVASDKLQSFVIEPFNVNNDAVQLNWEIPLGTGDSFQPLLRTKDMIFTAIKSDEKCKVICFSKDKKKPKKIWEKTLALSSSGDFMVMSDGRVLLTTNNGQIHELFADATNSIHYRILAENVTSALFNIKNKKLLTLGNKIELIDSITGWKIDDWKSEIKLSASKYSGVCIAKNTIFFSQNNAVFSLDRATGKKTYLEYVAFKEKPFSSSPCFYENNIYIGNESGTIYELALAKQDDISFLEKKWSFSTKGAIKSNPICVDKILYFGSDAGYAYAIDIATKKLKWSFKTQGKMRSTIIIHKDVAYFGCDGRRFYAVDINTGKLMWKKQASGKIKNKALIVDNKIYFASVAGELFCTMLSGKTLWKWDMPATIKTRPIKIGNKIVVGLDDGFIYFISPKK